MPSYLHNITTTWDLALFLCLVAILFFWGTSRGKNKIKFVILASYVALVIYGLLPLGTIEKSISAPSTPLIHIGIMIIMIAALSVLLQKIFRVTDSRYSWWKTLVLSLLAASFLMSIIVANTPHATTIFSALILRLFESDNALWWYSFPIVGMIFL